MGDAPVLIEVANPSSQDRTLPRERFSPLSAIADMYKALAAKQFYRCEALGRLAGNLHSAVHSVSRACEIVDDPPGDYERKGGTTSECLLQS